MALTNIYHVFDIYVNDDDQSVALYWFPGLEASKEWWEDIEDIKAAFNYFVMVMDVAPMDEQKLVAMGWMRFALDFCYECGSMWVPFDIARRIQMVRAWMEQHVEE